MKPVRLSHLPPDVRRQAEAQLAEHNGCALQEVRGMPSGASRCIYLPVTPVAAPRMTQRDKWNPRPVVLRYRSYCDALRANWHFGPFPPAGAHIVFHVPMPKSWSKKKKIEMSGKPHQQKRRNDVDNHLKAFLDALCEDDGYVYDVRVSKFWAESGYIEVFLNQMKEAA